ncbi:hypothetical protein Tco_1338793 [Tanacetum coccineum]
MIKDEVKSQLPQILSKEVSDFATPIIQSTITESLANVVLGKSSSQPQSTYEAAGSITEFELKKILLDKMQKNREDEDKDEDPPAGSNQGLKKRKTSKDADPSKGSNSKELRSSSSSKGTTSQLKSSDDQPDVEAALKQDWFKKPNKPPTPDREWNTTKSIDFRPPQTWISNNAKAKQPPSKFDELMSTPIDFSAFVMNSRQVVPTDYFINNNLEYLKGGSSSRQYTTSTTKTKVATYDNIVGIKDMVPTLWSPVKHNVYSTKRIIAVTHIEVMKWYDYGYLKEIEVRREDQQLYKFKEGDFPRLNLRNIEDLLLLLVQKKLSNLEKDVIFDLNVALQMFTRRIVILKRVEDLQLGVESYQKKLNITRPETHRSDIPSLTSYTAYLNPSGIIYQDKYKRNRLMRLDKLYKFCDGTLTSVRSMLHDIANNLRMEYLPKRS